MSSQPIGILGGTFDPVHYGHLRLALEIQQRLNLQQIRFIPCQKPVFDKTAHASSEQRLTMLKLAIAQQASFCVDDRELTRPTPSYMIDTLLSLRQEFGQQSICLMMGSDAFENLPRWHRWQELLSVAHLIVVTRPGHNLLLSEPLLKLQQQHAIQNADLLATQPHGYLLQAPITPLLISSTGIRAQIAQQFSPDYLLPDSVVRYIEQENLYKA